ncbi:hypothetical protein DSCW_63480 [Desulfosarcina widdelii]|uniref:Uncharacterized protein n=1 Tax=Desulfosarcina widdelii TaxID=947919 RepID=A0A5K7ZGM2_9BACT|nr:hypothetical protein [Desulfosarcina widdelii]BBO78931.1 hypothetical protein DSCW_63480 [Desulfosarcina widdelii]
MKAVYFPFTYLSESTARRLAWLVGPVVVYQPLETAIPAEIKDLEAKGLIEIRTPLAGDEDRLRSALSEFTEWASLNPGKLTAGADFLGARQGEVPFFDETAVNRIRSDIKNYGQAGRTEAKMDEGFSARLFLVLAQENDRAVDSLGQDLDRFKAMEKDFLETLKDADEAGFSRKAYASTLWREDRGARSTGQRIRAWANLAAADENLPEVMITTSPAVADLLLEKSEKGNGLEKLGDTRLTMPEEIGEPLLDRLLSGLGEGTIDLSGDICAKGWPAAPSETGADICLYAAVNRSPADWVGRLNDPDSVSSSAAKGTIHTLVVAVEV